MTDAKAPDQALEDELEEYFEECLFPNASLMEQPLIYGSAAFVQHLLGREQRRDARLRIRNERDEAKTRALMLESEPTLF